MTIIMAAMQNSLLTFESSKTDWTARESLENTHPQCVTIDPRNPNRAYCGTFGDGNLNNLLSMGKYNEAIKCYDKALEIDPKYALVWNNKGTALVSIL